MLAAVDHTDTAALETALAQTALGLVGVREEFEADYMATLATMERVVGGLVSLEQIQDAVNAAHDVVATRNAGVACSANFKVVDGGCVACPNERVHDAGTDPLEGDTFCVQPVPNVDSYGDAQVTAVDVLCVAVDCATADMDAIEALGCFDALAQLRLQGSVDTSKYTCSVVCTDSDACSGRRKRDGTVVDKKASNLRFLIASDLGDSIPAVQFQTAVNGVEKTSEISVTKSVRFQLDGAKNPVLVTPRGLSMLFDAGTANREGGVVEGARETKERTPDNNGKSGNVVEQDDVVEGAGETKEHTPNNNGKSGDVAEQDDSVLTKTHTHHKGKKKRGKLKHANLADLSKGEAGGAYITHKLATLISAMAGLVAFVLGVLFIARKRSAALDFKRKMRGMVSEKQLSASVANVIEESGGIEAMKKEKGRAKKGRVKAEQSETTALLDADVAEDAGGEYTLPSDEEDGSPARSVRGRGSGRHLHI